MGFGLLKKLCILAGQFGEKSFLSVCITHQVSLITLFISVNKNFENEYIQQLLRVMNVFMTMFLFFCYLPSLFETVCTVGRACHEVLRY